MKQQNRLLNERISQMERSNRKNNIVVSGVQVSTWEEASEAIDKISAKYAPRFQKPHSIRMVKTKTLPKIIATCTSLEHKLSIMKKKKDIKGPNGEPVFVDNDVTKEDSKILFFARQEAKKLRLQGKKVIIRDDKIIVDGQWLQFNAETETFNEKLDFQKRP